MQLTLSAIVFLSVHLFSAAFMAAAAYAVGRLITRSMDFENTTEETLFSLTAGLGAIATWLFLLGLLSGLSRMVVIGSLVAANVVALPAWRVAAGRLRDAARRRPILRSPLRAIPAAVALAPVAALAMYPPSQFDATLYHLPFARAFVETGGLPFLADLRFPVFPQLQELLFALGLFLSGEIAAQLSQLVALLLTAGVLFSWGRAAASTRAGLWAAALWLGTPLAVWLGGAAYVDVGLTLFVTAALACWERWHSSRKSSWLVLSAAMVGFAAATKYLGLFFFAALAVATIASAIHRRRAFSAVLFTAVAGAVMAPWYLRIFVLTGNPVFPFYPNLFGSGPWSDPAAARASEASGGVSHFLAAQLLDVVSHLHVLALAPWSGFFDRELFHWQAPLSPWFLILPPVLLIPALFSPVARRLLAIAAAYGLFWLTTIRDPRFLLPAAPVFALVLVLGAERLLAGRIGARASIAVAVLLFAPGWIYAVYKATELGPPPMDSTQREAFLQRHVRGYGAVSFLNTSHGSDYSAYFLGGEHLRYYADGRLLGDLFGPHKYGVVLVAAGRGDALHRRLTELGVDHLAVLKPELGSRLPDDSGFREHFKPVFRAGDDVVFEIR